MNVDQPYLKLNNEFEFKAHCCRQSIKAFDWAINKKLYIPRFNFVCILLTEVSLTPFYLAHKVSEAAFYIIWHLLNSKEKDSNFLQFKCLIYLTKLVIFQVSLPFIYTAIRICATISGLLVPYWALFGWKIAEHREESSYNLWSYHLNNSICQTSERLVHEEIIPSNAIFYLGEKNAYLYLVKEVNQRRNLEQDISPLFSNLLQDIAIANPLCFRKLFYYDSAITSEHQLCKHHPYLLSPDIKDILFHLKQNLPANDSINENEVNSWLIEQISKDLSIDQIKRMFSHIYLNLQGALLWDNLKFDVESLKKHFTLLEDLLCIRFSCGRACFPQTSNGLQLYSLT